MGLSVLKTVWERIVSVTRSPNFADKVIGCSIPLLIVGYIAYLNILPFGYSKTFTIKVGSDNDTSISEFYLEPAQGLSERLYDNNGRSYRNLVGVAVARFKPKANLKNADIEISVDSPDASIIPSQINISASSTSWDYSWDFSRAIPENVKNTGIFYFEGTSYFDGSSYGEYASSSNILEDGPFTIYAEWTPINSEDSFQEIVGHYNWELLQERNQVRFMVGRMNQKEGPFYSVEYPISNPGQFFNASHTAVATYSPDPKNGNGYIELYVDGLFAKRVNIGKDVIWKDYNGSRNITFGKSDHGTAKYFKGTLKNVNIVKKVLINTEKTSRFTLPFTKELRIPLVTTSSVPVYELKLHVTQR